MPMNTALNASYVLDEHAQSCGVHLIYRGPDGKSTADTLKVYSDMAVSASAESVRRVLEDVQRLFPSEHYGMLISSHGSGWLPGGYGDSSERVSTRAIGNQYAASGKTVTASWIEVPDLAAAIPFHLDYLILDVCLAGAVEVAWELQDVCDRLVVSPAEILTTGMGYSILSWYMLAYDKPDLMAYCLDYYNYYNDYDNNDYDHGCNHNAARGKG